MQEDSGNSPIQDIGLQIQEGIRHPPRPRTIIRKQNLVRRIENSFREYYISDKKLGSGTFGTVYLVMHKKLKIQRAMKVIEKKQYQVLLKQISLLKQLDHPNILKIYQYFQDKNRFYIITEYFEGKELFHQITTNANRHLTERVAANILFEIIKGLNYIHSKNIAHRDIKAQNIMVRQQDGKYIVKIVDWGLSTKTWGSKMDNLCGTIYYYPPQMIIKQYDLSCDMWSLGVLAYAMLQGNYPFKGRDDSDDQGIKQSILKGLVLFSDKPKDAISLVAKRFVLCLLDQRPSNRLTAQKCLNHQWIKHYIDNNNQQDEVSLESTLVRIKEMYSFNHFQIVTFNYIENFIHLIKQEIRLKKEFQLLDVNSDGSISREEFANAYRKIYGIDAQLISDQLFKKIDLDNSGDITYSEYVTFAADYNQQFTNEQLKEAFNLFDLDGDGFIDKKQIRRLIQFIPQELSNDRQYQEIIRQIDLNGDGKIDFSQFSKHICEAIQKSRQSIRQRMEYQ